MAKILIGIMSHNYARYINEAVQSALAQTIHCDVLVTDDGSTDNTEAELLKYGDKIMWIVHHDNSGDELRAIEDIIAYSTPYDYIFIMSADDCLYHDSIQRLVDKARDTGSDWTYGGLDVIDEHGALLSRWTYDGFPESVQEAIQYMLDNKSLGTTLGSLFSGKFLNGKKPSRFPHTNFSLDASTAIDWYTYNPIIRRLRGQVAKYRRHSESRTSKCNHERRIMQKDLTEKIERVFKHSLKVDAEQAMHLLFWYGAYVSLVKPTREDEGLYELLKATAERRSGNTLSQCGVTGLPRYQPGDLEREGEAKDEFRMKLCYQEKI